MNKLTFLHLPQQTFLSILLSLQANFIPTTFQEIIAQLPIYQQSSCSSERRVTDAPILSSYCIYKCQQMDRNFDMDQIYFTTIEYRNHLLRFVAICVSNCLSWLTPSHYVLCVPGITGIYNLIQTLKGAVEISLIFLKICIFCNRHLALPNLT